MYLNEYAAYTFKIYAYTHIPKHFAFFLRLITVDKITILFTPALFLMKTLSRLRFMTQKYLYPVSDNSSQLCFILFHLKRWFYWYSIDIIKWLRHIRRKSEYFRIVLDFLKRYDFIKIAIIFRPIHQRLVTSDTTAGKCCLHLKVCKSADIL